MFRPDLVGWQVQYDRMMRGFARLQRPYAGSVDHQDDLYHFVQDCFHLKDWIKGDQRSGVDERAVEREYGQHRILLVIADLANAAKHLERNRDRVGAYAISNSVTIHIGSEPSMESVYTFELADGSRLHLDDLLKPAIDAWHRVLAALGLAPNKR